MAQLHKLINKTFKLYIERETKETVFFVCYTCRIRCDFTCKLCSDSIFCMFFTLIFGDIFFLLFLILANCVHDESRADSSNGSEDCGTYRFLCTQMKILQLLEFGYIFCLFSQKHDRKGSSQKNIHRRRISPSSTIVYIIKKNCCLYTDNLPYICRIYFEHHHLWVQNQGFHMVCQYPLCTCSKMDGFEMTPLF